MISVNERHKRAALEMIPYGLYVVGVGRGQDAGAYTANWVCQASFVPPLLMLGVKVSARPRKLIESERVLTVNFLGEGQKKIAASFIKWHGPKGETLAGHPFVTGVTGAPILADAPAYVECEVRQIVTAGDHDVVLAEVVEAGVRRASEPLMMSNTGWSYGG